jgi:hypothetical protein
MEAESDPNIFARASAAANVRSRRPVASAEDVARGPFMIRFGTLTTELHT